MHPTEETKLLLQVSTLERHNEAHESKRVEREADEPVAHSEAGQLGIGEYNMLHEMMSSR